ncbi:MAG: glycoside hydrolase family 20 protein [Kiritimatiellia bacterium]
MKTTLLASVLLVGATVFGAFPEVIPELKVWTAADQASAAYAFNPNARIAVASNNAQLMQYAKVFAEELGVKVVDVSKADRTMLCPVRWFADTQKKGDIVLSVGGKGTETLGDEGYTLTVTPENLHISAKTPLGAFWGTRSVLQVFAAQNKTFPSGIAKDWPTYKIRGFMFDCGRKPFTLTTLRQIVKIMSYYKLNDLQLHLSDNYIWLQNFPGVKTAEDVLALDPAAGAFRLESKIDGLTATDISYTKKEFRALIAEAASQGVGIIPEIDVPGHALPLVRVRPDLMYKGSVGNKHDLERAAMLDLKNPKTLPFITSVFDEYIDDGTFSNDVVHIGTDEYYGDSESYRAFADQLLKHILAKGKTPRLWGSLSHKRGKTAVHSEGVQMNIWSMGWQNPREALAAGYDIINILDVHTYSVPNGTGNIGGYGDDINSHWLYDHWTPAAFPGKDQAVDPKNPKLLGGAWAIWNDNSFIGDMGLTGRDLLPRIRKNCAVIAQKTWTDKNLRNYEAFTKQLTDNGGPVDVTIPAWEESYTVTRDANQKTVKLATGDETDLYAVSPVNGNVGFRREAAQYTFDYSLPVGKKVTLTFKASERKVELFADGQPVGGTPRRQFWPKSCKFFTLPRPEKSGLCAVEMMSK